MSARPEWKLLLSCTSSPPGDAEAEPSPDSRADPALDWDFLVQTASRQGVVPQLFRRLQRRGGQSVPAAVLSRLSLQYRANAARNTQLMEELAALLTLFQAHHIPAIPYKGPALAATVYGDLALRACGDLDILLHPEDVLRAKDLLLAAGYQPVQQFREAAEEVQHLQSDCEYNFQRASDGILVELHWRFRPEFFPLPLNMDDLWARAEAVTLGGIAALSFAPEDLLLILCVHGAKHRWERLCWISDIAQILYAFPDLDWDRAWEQARAAGCRRVLLLGLALAQELLGAALPKSAPKKMPPVINALRAQVQRELFGKGAEAHDIRARMLFHLRVRDRLQDRLPYVRHHVRQRARRQMEEWKA